eukprot:UN10876
MVKKWVCVFVYFDIKRKLMMNVKQKMEGRPFDRYGIKQGGK